jgi:hypothetical protein
MKCRYYDSYPFVQFLKSPKPAGFFSDELTFENEAGREWRRFDAWAA